MREMIARAGRPGLTVGVDELRGGGVRRERREAVRVGCCARTMACKQTGVSFEMERAS